MRTLSVFFCFGAFLLFFALPVKAEVKVIPVNALTPINQESPAATTEEPMPPAEVLHSHHAEMESPAVEAMDVSGTMPSDSMPEMETPPAPEVQVDKISPSPVDRSAFSRLKSLVGKWQGTGLGQAHQPDEKIEVEYRMTAGGSAVMEILFPDTPQEMTTLYYESNGNLMLTHYCMLGNRPNMELKSQKENVYEFDFMPSSGINAAIDTHMHKLKISFIDASHMNQEWTMFEAGKAAGSHSFQLTRVPAL